MFIQEKCSKHTSIGPSYVIFNNKIIKFVYHILPLLELNNRTGGKMGPYNDSFNMKLRVQRGIYTKLFNIMAHAGSQLSDH